MTTPTGPTDQPRRMGQLTSGPLRAVHGYYDLPPWSPVDGRIAYTATESTAARTGSICVMDDDGASPRQLAMSRAISPNGGAMAQWSVDGARMMFVFTNEIAYDRKYGELPRVKDSYVVIADGTAHLWVVGV